MNRDWFAQSQPETRGRLRLFLDWYPHVAVDLHEMGGDSTYYFAPPARPLNPYFTRAQQDWLEAFGRAIAARFDAAGQAYFVREVFDSFYPGYGETWPLMQGSIGMTFEQASARGLVFRREDGTQLTYLDGIRNHFRAALATVETAARGREKLLRDFLEFRRSAVCRGGDRGRCGSTSSCAGADRARLDRLAGLLAGQGIEMRVAAAELRAGGRSFPAGSIVVPLAQPASRLARNLLDPRVSMDEAFVKEQERRRKKRLPDQIYDVTAWSLPLVFDVECAGVATLTGETRPFAPEAAAGLPALAAAKVAWLLPWGSGTAAAVVEALQEGLKVRVAEAGLPAGRPRLPRRHRHRPGGREPGRRSRVAGAHRAATRRRGGGGRLRIRRGRRLARQRARAPRQEAAGAARVGPADLEPVRRLGPLGAGASLRPGGHGRPRLVAPARGPLALRRARAAVRRLRPDDRHDCVKRLHDWVDAGGTLVALGEASRWLTREKVGLLDTKTELRDGRPEAEPPRDGKEDEEKAEATEKEGKPEPFELEKAIQPERERPDAVPGALLRVTLDPEHWLAAGTDGEIHAIVESRRVFTPLKLDKGTNVGVYARKDQVVGSGLVWDDVRDLLAQKAFLMHQPIGEGHVVAFAEDPNHRGYAEATELLFMNAVLLGPAY